MTHTRVVAGARVSSGKTPTTTSALPSIQSRLLYPRREAAHLLGISIRSLDYLIASGDLRCRRIAGRVLIPHEELVRFAARDYRGSVLKEAA